LVILFLQGLLTGRLFALSPQMEEIKKIEALEKAKPLPPLRPRIEYQAKNLRDPFQGLKITGSTVAVAKAAPPALTIQGIVWGGSLPQAIINNKVVKIGDTIEEARIIDINKDGVTIFFGGRQYNLASPAAATVQKKTEEKAKGGKDEK